MEGMLENFDNIHKCIECSKPIKIVKLKFIKDKIKNITKEELMNFKQCSKCKRKAIRYDK